jgi:transcriptional regulator with XRE-family HTH domain
MFSDKVKQILALLETSSADIARISDCDKSHISRMVSGARKPKVNGAAVRRLADGIYLAADEKGRTDKLCEVIQCERDCSANEIKAHLIKWLYDGEETDAAKPRSSADRTPYREFGEKLGAAMELTGLSNIRMGRLLNIDPSYISRFRSGLRSPKANRKMMSDICVTLTERAASQGKLSALARLTGADGGPSANRENVSDAVYEWLYSTERTDDAPVVQGRIDQLGSFSADIVMPPLSFEEAADAEIVSEDISAYYGTAGLRRAVIRFLGNVFLRGEKELYLYSDQNMEWMTGDPYFRAKWASLMILCVTNGTRISIIHNINRDLSEMTDAIKSWLPLYPSGMIKSYYCKLRAGDRFSTTLFLSPGYACISGSNAVGTENESGMYRFDTGADQLNAHRIAYDELLEHSGELAKVQLDEDTRIPGEADVRSTAVLSDTLSLATMPEITLRSVILRSGKNKAELSHIRAVWEKHCELLKQTAENGTVYEYAPLPSDEELFCGKVRADIPGISAAYTPKEYADHIRSIIDYLESYPNYRLCIIPEKAFEDIRLIVSERSVAVTRLKAPYITIRFDHPDLRRAFNSYIDRIRKQYNLDKLTTIHKLEQYL